MFCNLISQMRQNLLQAQLAEYQQKSDLNPDEQQAMDVDTTEDLYNDDILISSEA